MPSALRTLEQERAKHAWECVQQCLSQAIQQLDQAIQQLESEIARESDKERRKGLEERSKRLRERLQSLQSEKGGEDVEGQVWLGSAEIAFLHLNQRLGANAGVFKSERQG